MVCSPSRLVRQPYTLDYADAVKETAALAGIDQMQWQVNVIRDWSAHNAQGHFIHRRCGASIPRQAGKSVDGIVWTVFLAAIMGYSVLWTDHNYSTTCEMLRRFQKIFGKRPNDKQAEYPLFNGMVKSVSNKTAQEAIFLSNGGLICFSTRTKSAALGYSFDVVVYDEAQELTVEQMQAIQPTTTSGAHHNTQFLFIGTPTRAGSSATVFADMREEAVRDPRDDLSWTEYGTDNIDDIDHEGRWHLFNPSIDEGVADVDAIRSGIRAFGADRLAAAQEYLGYWLPRAANALISESEWEDCRIDPAKAPADGAIAYGVKFSPDGAEVSLAVALKPDSGPIHVEIVAIEPMSKGFGWLADWLIARPDVGSCVCIDGKAGAGTLIERIAGKVPSAYVMAPRASDVITASAMTLEAIQTGAISHIEQPALDASATKSTRRKIGADGGWGFGGDTSSPIEAVSLAIFAVKTTKRNPHRVQEASF